MITKGDILPMAGVKFCNFENSLFFVRYWWSHLTLWPVIWAWNRPNWRDVTLKVFPFLSKWPPVPIFDLRGSSQTLFAIAIFGPWKHWAFPATIFQFIVCVKLLSFFVFAEPSALFCLTWKTSPTSSVWIPSPFSLLIVFASSFFLWPLFKRIAFGAFGVIFFRLPLAIYVWPGLRTLLYKAQLWGFRVTRRLFFFFILIA